MRVQNKLYKDFVVVPIDKASSNVSFICKNHYADVIKKELKFSVNREDTLGDTYKNINTPANDIIQAHAQVLGKFDLSLQEKMKKTCMYALESKTTQRSSWRKIHNRFS